MSLKREARLIVSAAIAVTLGGGLFLYVTPASTNVNAAPVAERPAILNLPPYQAWGEGISENAGNPGPIVESWRDGGYSYYENR